jgi:hypothetical protein
VRRAAAQRAATGGRASRAKALKLSHPCCPGVRRRHTYTNALTWLKQQGGPTYRISSVFQWNAGSWDVQGVRYDSVGFRNEELSSLIAAHNKAITKRK